MIERTHNKTQNPIVLTTKYEKSWVAKQQQLQWWHHFSSNNS